jgi:4-hydroxythreonine-4-phosphate dehydrogenase
MKKNIRIAISMGEPTGIGPEVLVKALGALKHVKDATFYVCGDLFVLSRYGFKNQKNVRLLDLKNVTPEYFSPGAPSKETAQATLEYLKVAVNLIKKGECYGLVTAPLSKEHVARAGFLWPGHTEFLAHAFGVSHVEMVFVSDALKVVLATRHMSLKDAIRSITETKIERCGDFVLKFLKDIVKIKNPSIAVCGLNPHASESGLFGSEEKASIIPAIKKLNKVRGEYFFGPFAADTIFRRARQGEFDLVMAMYHDQGLIPFKMASFQKGVNVTIGLPFIRTSPLHGTAFDIAGKNIADHHSMEEALRLACLWTKCSPK